MDIKFQNARKLRKNSIVQESKLWSILRNRNLNNLKFKRQVPICHYIVDFCCSEKKLVIELDGGQHNECQNIEYDKKRTLFLNEQGYKVVRIWNNEINDNLDGVVEYLLDVINTL